MHMKYYIVSLFIAISFSSANGQLASGQNIEEKKMCMVKKGKYKPFINTKLGEDIQVESFYLDEYAVTNKEFLAFVKANPRWSKSRISRMYADTNYLRHWESDYEIGISQQEIYESPVVNVSWFAAKAYCTWKNKRLPKVSEWELAASALPKKKINVSLTDYILEWYKKPNEAVLPNVKSTYQNTTGLYDMHGLIWEWTFDFNNFVSSGDSRVSEEEERNLFCASASLNVKDRDDYASFLRFGYRGSLKGNYCIANLGFRCARDISK